MPKIKICKKLSFTLISHNQTDKTVGEMITNVKVASSGAADVAMLPSMADSFQEQTIKGQQQESKEKIEREEKNKWESKTYEQRTT